MPNRNTAPEIKDPRAFEVKLQPYSLFELNNGVPLYKVSGGAEDVFKIEWIFSAGNYLEKKRCVASVVSSLLKSGTSSKSSFEINQMVDYYGAFLSFSSYNEFALIRLQSLTKHLSELLPLVREIITDTVFPEKEVEIYKKNTLQRLIVSLQEDDFVADREINAAMYGAEHPYGMKLEAADIEAISREDVLSFYDEYYKSGDCKIFASGKLPDDLDHQMNHLFGDLNIHQPKSISRIDRVLSNKKSEIVVANAEGVQSSIRIARTFPNKLDPDYKKAKVLNVLLGGYFGSRLMANIREDKGYTYGIYSYFDEHQQFGSWVIATEAGRQVRNETIAEIYKELEELKNIPAGEEEMNLVRNYLMGIQLAALDGPFRTIDQWKGLILNDLPEDFFKETVATIKNVTPKELQEVAQKYFGKEDFYEVVAE